MNLFSKMKPNKLMALLQQQEPQPTPMNRAKMTRDEAFLGGQQVNPVQAQPEDVGAMYGKSLSPDMGPIMKSGAAKSPSVEDAGGLLWRAATVGASPLAATGLVGKKLFDMTQQESPKTVNAPPQVSAAPPASEEPPSDEQMKAGAERGFGGDLGLGGSMDLVKKLAQEAQSRQGQQDKLRADYEGTPELDELIAKARGQLDTARGERKQPGLGEFLTLALMNLGNRDHRNNADMVLGTGEQREKERHLENQLSQLEGGRASAKMGGRRGFQASQQKDRYSALERMMQTQEFARKQQNSDRDFGFKNQKMGFDKLMQAIGQMRQQLATETDPGKKKSLQDQIDRMDPYNPRNQQGQQAPQDNRQSRMFGDLLGGGGYA